MATIDPIVPRSGTIVVGCGGAMPGNLLPVGPLQ